MRPGVLTTRKARPKRLLSTLFAASAVLFVVAGVAFAVDRGVIPTLAKPEPSPTVPTPDPPIQANGPAKDPSPGNRRATAAKPKEPRAVAVSVVNAAGTQGLAATKSELLRRKKVRLKTVGNLSATRGRSVVFFKGHSAPYARRIGRLLGIRRVEPTTREIAASGKGARVIVVLGRDSTLDADT